MATSEQAPSLYHPDLDHIVISQDPSDPSSSPDSWFVAVKLMQTCIEQVHRDFSVFNHQISRLKSELATLNTWKSGNKGLLEKNTKANLIIEDLHSQIGTPSTSALPEKRHLSEKFPDPELYDRYTTEASKIQYSVGRLTEKH